MRNHGFQTIEIAPRSRTYDCCHAPDASVVFTPGKRVAKETALSESVGSDQADDA
jgi:hypothetical protein